jgi:hypothetical protein
MIWTTCCALHNWLLEIDGLDEPWQDGMTSSWEHELGQYDEEDIKVIQKTVRRRRLTPDEVRMYDSSGMDFGDDYTRVCEEDDTNER